VIISVAHSKGGVGKSTLAVNIAQVMGADILDLDLQRSSLFWNRTRGAGGYKGLNVHTPNDIDEAKKIMNEYKTNGLLVTDCGGFDSESNRVALNRSIIITPVSPSNIELYGLQNFIQTLKKASELMEREIIANVVINNADVRSQGAIADVKEFVLANNKHLKLLDTVIHCRSDFKWSFGEGLSVVESNSKSKAAEEITTLVSEIKNKFNIV